MTTVTLRGYAVTYNQTAFLGHGDGRLERILPGAFSAQLAAGKPIQLQTHTHDPAEPAIASTADGTLTFHEDEVGLGVPGPIRAARTPGTGASCERLSDAPGWAVRSTSPAG